MIEALQMHLALEYEFFETPADIVESAIFEMYTRIVMCGTLDDKQKREVNDRKVQKTRNEQRHFSVAHSVLFQPGISMFEPGTLINYLLLKVAIMIY